MGSDRHPCARRPDVYECAGLATMWLLAPERLGESRAVFDFLPAGMQLTRAPCEGAMPRRRESLLV